MNDLQGNTPTQKIASLRQLFRLKRRGSADAAAPRHGGASLWRRERAGSPEGDTTWLETEWGDTRQQAQDD